MRIFKKSVYFLFESGSLDSPGGPSSNRRFSIPCFAQWMVTGLKAALWPSLLIFSITIHWSHLIRRPYAKRRGRRETMRDCPLSKTVKILDQRSCSICRCLQISNLQRFFDLARQDSYFLAAKYLLSKILERTDWSRGSWLNKESKRGQVLRRRGRLWAAG